MTKKKILIIGATGMLGNGIFSQLTKKRDLDVYGTVRYLGEAQKFLPEKLIPKIQPNIDVENIESLIKVFEKIKPHIVINCVGLIKQIMGSSDYQLAIYLNSFLPHRLAQLCQIFKVRLIHFSTDCVFSGQKGNYQEKDYADAPDLYGRTKYLGEVDYGNALTIRTSIIGHGLESHVSLIDWFLAQKGKIRGFSKVIYSGLPTVEQANIIDKYIIPNPRLKGLYHISARPISKYDLLKLVAKVYNKKIKIEPDDKIVADMSLDSSRFRKKTGYQPPNWRQLIQKMYQYYQTNPNFIKF